MIKILFVCHGNICRSPMAEFIMKDLIRRRHLSQDFCIESAATSSEEDGRDMYPPAREKLMEKHIPFKRRSAHKMGRKDYDIFDYIFYMDKENYRGIRRIVLKDPAHKILPLLEEKDIADPWYTDDFETAWQDIRTGCEQRLEEILQDEKVQAHIHSDSASSSYDHPSGHSL